MGNIWSGGPETEDRQHAGPNSNVYQYPAKTDTYFGSHFLLGGERFEIDQPESFLFGDNADLNWIGPKASQVSQALCQKHTYMFKSPCLTEKTYRLCCYLLKYLVFGYDKFVNDFVTYPYA